MKTAMQHLGALLAGFALIGALLGLLFILLAGVQELPRWLRLVGFPVAFGGFCGFAVWLGAWLDDPKPAEHWRKLIVYLGFGAGIVAVFQLAAVLWHFLSRLL